jgi:hypothetical protein
LLDRGSSHRHDHRHFGFLLQGRRGHPSRVAWHFICHYPTPRALVLRGVSSVYVRPEEISLAETMRNAFNSSS